MIYKTYKAENYKEAIFKARMELGSDIYIIGRQEVKEGGILGLFAKKMVQITVAKKEESLKDRSKGKTTKKDQTNGEAVNEDNKLSLVSGDLLLKEIIEIKNRLNNIAQEKTEVKHNDLLEPYVKVLEENDFSNDFINKIRDRFEGEVTLKDVKDPKVIVKKILDYIGEFIDDSGPITPGKKRPEVVVLVGPTGVGKTTTIAKLAASYGVLKKHRVELVTIDSYRIAAVEQLGKYAELMQIPFTVINSREEFREYLSNCSAEIVFVDTAGKSQKNNIGLAELKNILDGAKQKLDVHLVISATTKYRDAIDIFTRFNQLMYEKIIVSKLDETNTVGSIISALAINKERKISYFTIGQSVPDDIELAKKEKLLDMIPFDEVVSIENELAV